MLMTLEEMKKYLRIDSDYTEEDELITTLIESAEEMLINQTGLSLEQLSKSKLSKVYISKYVAEMFENRGSSERTSSKTQNVLDAIIAQLSICQSYRGE